MPRRDDPHPYIHRLRALGMADDVIYSRLLLEGWSKEVLEPIFLARARRNAKEDLHVYQYDTEPAHEGEAQPISRRISIVVMLVVFFSLAAFGSAAYMYIQPPVVYSISLPESSSDTGLDFGALPALSDEDYYGTMKQNLIEKKASFIDANLSKMELSVFRDGELKLTVPIAAKGKVGSWWETPSGIYKIQSKEKIHFSTFGAVYQPWSLNFQGNFYVHGWPYYEGGEPVSKSYSGGCVRLSSEDAEKVFDLVDAGIPIIVHDSEGEPDDFAYQVKAPNVFASAFLVADLKNGTVLSSKNSDIAAPIASLSKLVSALVATEYINLDKELRVSRDALVYTSIPRLRAGTSIRAYDLLYLLLLESSNEAAETLASWPGRSQFIYYMNQKAKAINLTQTVFSDPSGAKGDYSTPEDLFKLLRYIYENRRFVLGMTAGEISSAAYDAPVFRNIRNFNLIPNAGAKFVGGKIGQTNEAGETYAGIFTVRIGKEERDIAIIVLGSKDVAADVRKLLASVQNTYAPAQ